MLAILVSSYNYEDCWEDPADVLFTLASSKTQGTLRRIEDPKNATETITEA